MNLTKRELDLIDWMLDTAVENNPDDEELSDLQEKVGAMRIAEIGEGQ